MSNLLQFFLKIIWTNSNLLQFLHPKQQGGGGKNSENLTKKFKRKSHKEKKGKKLPGLVYPSDKLSIFIIHFSRKKKTKFLQAEKPNKHQRRNQTFSKKIWLAHKSQNSEFPKGQLLLFFLYDCTKLKINKNKNKNRSSKTNIKGKHEIGK